jgi:hypothetical protein
VHGYRVLLAETFVDEARFAGTCYLAANWIEVGRTRGFGKCNTRYTEHGHKKRVLVYPLDRQARIALASAVPHPRLPLTPVKPMHLSDEDADSLVRRLQALPDVRTPAGRRHNLASMLALAICAVISGARGSNAIAEWGQRATQPMLRRLRCRFDRKLQRHVPPSEATLRRALCRMALEPLERLLGQWLMQPVPLAAVALDGKTLKGSRRKGQPAKHLVSVLTHGTGIVVNQRPVADKSNEITAVKPLLDPLPLAGCVVTADALHTQNETARYLVEDKKADYVFTVKDNQPTLKNDIQSLGLQALPP